MFPRPISSAASRDDLQEVADRLEARKSGWGSPVMSDNQDLIVEELQQLASDEEIPGRSTMNHDELAATVSPG